VQIEELPLNVELKSAQIESAFEIHRTKIANFPFNGLGESAASYR
jgi:hypothetical protein